MPMKRRRFSAEFKARAALDALSSELTLAGLSNKYDDGAKSPQGGCLIPNASCNSLILLTPGF